MFLGIEVFEGTITSIIRAIKFLVISLKDKSQLETVSKKKKQLETFLWCVDWKTLFLILELFVKAMFKRLRKNPPAWDELYSEKFN